MIADKQKILHDIYIKLVEDAITNEFSLYLAISGNSMSPIIESGEKILIRTVMIDEIKIGDIVIYKKNNKFISHRIISTDCPQFMIKGDNRLIGQSYNYGSIFGKVISIEKSSGMIINLEAKKWCAINYLIAKCSLYTWLIYKKLYFIKRRCLGDRNSCFLDFISKIIQFCIHTLLKLFICTILP